MIFVELSQLGSTLEFTVYFAHPYAAHERGANERNNGLLKRFIHKGEAISYTMRILFKSL